MFSVTCTRRFENWNTKELKPRVQMVTMQWRWGIKSPAEKDTDLKRLKYRASMAADSSWLMTVAQAAPAMPQPQAKIKIGSSRVFSRAPATMDSME